MFNNGKYGSLCKYTFEDIGFRTTAIFDLDKQQKYMFNYNSSTDLCLNPAIEQIPF